ncbi:GtrA family protein [Endozoicomonadaceae bacterium StTr2]
MNKVQKIIDIYSLFRFSIVSILINIAGYIAYIFITYAGLPYKVTATLLYAFVAIAGYIGHKKISFSHDGVIISSALKYFLAHLAGYSINISTLIVVSDIWGYPHEAAQAIAIILVACFFYVTYKFYVFSK